VDAHVHIGFADPLDVLRRGVTTVRDLGWPPQQIFELSRASRSSAFPGPLIVAVGPILTAPGGYPTRAAWAPPGTGREVAGRRAATQAVRELAGQGASAIKISLNPPAGPVLDDRTLRALAGAAHELERKVTGHIHGLAELDKAIECGVDELAHMLMSEEELPGDVIERMTAAAMAIVPTLSVRFGRDREIAIANLAAWRRAGGRVVYGTDLGNEGPGPGIDRLEVRAMAAAGSTTVEIVRSATTAAAGQLALGGKGTILPGMHADVVAVPLDALEDPEKLCDVRIVWREGRRAL
jgi:imidazolonepropionase-like amidohydrolase